MAKRLKDELRIMKRIAFWCLPWLPLSLLTLTTWDRYFAPKKVIAARLSVDKPMIIYSEEEQWAQVHPHWNLIVAALLIAALLFILGLILLMFIYARSRRDHAAQTI